MYIYKITNCVNGKCYIGQTRSKRVNDRIGKHRLELNKGIHANKHLQRSWNKHSENNFTFNIIETCDSVETLNGAEIFWIKHFNSMNPDKGFNKESGGNRYKETSEETRQKKLKALIGRAVSDETRKRISQAHSGENSYWFGKRRSEETKAKMSASHRKRDISGPKNSAFGKPGRHHRPIRCLDTGETFYSVRAASIALGIDYSNIFKVLKGEKNTHRGFRFEYLK